MGGRNAGDLWSLMDKAALDLPAEKQPQNPDKCQQQQMCFVVLLLPPCNPLHTAPEWGGGSIYCLIILGLSAILQINLREKSIYPTLSTLIYTTFPMMPLVTNAKGLLKTYLNANVFHVQSTAVWGGEECVVLKQLAQGHTGSCRAGSCACECMLERCSPQSGNRQ